MLGTLASDDADDDDDDVETRGGVEMMAVHYVLAMDGSGGGGYISCT